MQSLKTRKFLLSARERERAVSGQNKTGRELTLLALIQPTVIKQQAVNNNWLLKLQPAVILQSRQKSNLNRIECD